ncbi:tRNA 4-thiouridine(8) synthase ThiI [Candidatus Uhrbacteria bacterium]|nr:tRNA 4-thiouridine(8) synthase ThiI [Candidatus Uhrbacteria bacterium]
MQQVYVVHYHEIALKGRNRPDFLRQLQENICRATGLRKGSVKIVSGRLLVRPPLNLPLEKGEKIVRALQRTFGISSFSPAALVKAEYGEIVQAVKSSIVPSMELFTKWNTFAIRATRGDKEFSLTSKEIEVKLGDFVREKFKKKVDLESPDVTFYVEVFSAKGGSASGGPGGAVVYTEKIPGPGGLPVGTQGKAAVMLSGGIDSPVAAYRILKRGAPIVGVHFHSYPFTSRASIDKVKELAGVLARYGGPFKLFLVPLTDAQKAVIQNCEERYRVLLYRRLMVRIAQELARHEGAQALVTGEALGQVASQTIENIGVTDAAATLLILRPLIGYDKEEIIAEAKRIGTYEISILPHDDCCTIMMPKNPATRARLSDVEREEVKLEVSRLIDNALECAELITLPSPPLS